MADLQSETRKLKRRNTMSKIPNATFANESTPLRGFTLFEDDYEVKCGLTVDERQKVFQLRAGVFCHELGWVGSSVDTHEFDGFDNSVTHIAAFSQNKAIACLRVHPHSSDWMMSTIFRDLISDPSQFIKSPEACEVSRLAVDQAFRRHRFHDTTEPIDALYRGLFAFCMHNNIRYVYMITSLPVLRALRHRGLPCEEIGQRKKMDGGIVALPARLDWVRFMSENQKAHPARLDRFLAALRDAGDSLSDDDGRSRRSAQHK